MVHNFCRLEGLPLTKSGNQFNKLFKILDQGRGYGVTLLPGNKAILITMCKKE